jgi:cbb3-type cytochrome oxidase subunit 1
MKTPSCVPLGASENFTLRSVHAHINLLGWATMALAGLIYSVFPQTGQSRLAKIHFWLHNIALPILLVSLSFLILGNKQVIPLLGGAEIITAIGIIAFVAIIFLNLKKA